MLNKNYTVIKIISVPGPADLVLRRLTILRLDASHNRGGHGNRRNAS